MVDKQKTRDQKTNAKRVSNKANAAHAAPNKEDKMYPNRRSDEEINT